MLRKNLPAVLIIINAVILYSFTVPWHAINDAYLFLNSYKMFTSTNWEYLLGVFTSNNHGDQYRPLSFATYFVLGGKIWGTHSAGWELFSISCFVMMLWQCYKFFCALSPEKKLPVLYLLVFSLHPFLWGVRDWSFTLKYFFTLGVFLHLCRLVILEEYWSTKYFIRFNVLTFLAILCQEAAITWGIQFLCIQYFKSSKLRIKDFTVFIWLIVYIVARKTFLFKENYSAMTFDFLNLPNGAVHYLSSILIPVLSFNETDFSNSPINFNILILLLLSIVFIYKFFHFKDKVSLLLFVLSLCNILPYAGLANHIVPEHAIWSIPFLTIAFIHLFSNWPVVRNVVLTLFLVIFIKSNLDLRNRYFSSIDKIKNYESIALRLNTEIQKVQGDDLSVGLGQYNYDYVDHDWIYKPVYPVGVNSLFILKPMIREMLSLTDFSYGYDSKLILLRADPSKYYHHNFFEFRHVLAALARVVPDGVELLIIPGMGQPRYIQDWEPQPSFVIKNGNFFYSSAWTIFNQDYFETWSSDSFSQLNFSNPKKFKEIIRLKI
ncbi:MAG: hypothetical protein K2P81_07455 [Bacteriovoracaceae bacterium]|nr:hypothetical protein [Bacteriovoracaceae bacterium]